MIIEASKNYALLLQLKAAAFLVFLSFLSGALAVISFEFAAVFGAVSLMFYLLSALFYIRRFVNSLYACIDGEKLIIKKGVIIEKCLILPLSKVRYYRVRKTPLSGLMGICTVIVYTSSGRVAIFGLNNKAADELANCTEVDKIEKTV